MAFKLTKDNFDKEVMESNIPVLVDFWAPWCGPCRTVASAIEELSKEYEGKIKVCKLNVDEEASIASRFNIMSIPTLIIFKDKKVLTRQTGALFKDKLVEFITPHI